MQCPACGAEVFEQAVYCHKCGERVGNASEGLDSSPRPSDDVPADPMDRFERAAAMRQDAKDRPEVELWQGGYSPKAMLGAWVVCGLLDAALLVAGILLGLGVQGWLILLALMLLPWIYGLGVLGYRRMSVRYRLTSQRFIHESGILRRVNDRIEVLDMDDIAYEQGILERLVGVGTIRIHSSDRSHPDFSLPGIEDVQRVAGLFDDARCDERRRRGLHLEQI